MGTVKRGVRNVLRSPIRLALVVALLGTSLMFVATMFALNASAQQRLSAARSQIGTGIDVRPAGSFGPFSNGRTLTASQVKTIENTPGVDSLSEEVTEQYSGTAINGLIKPVIINNGGSGAAPSGSPSLSGGPITPMIYGLAPGQSQYTLLDGSIAKMASGRNLSTSETKANVALMSAALAKANKLKVGSTFTLKGTTFTLVGLFSTGSDGGDNTIIIPLATAQRVYNLTGVSSVIAYAASDSTVDRLVTRLKSALGSSVDVTSQSAQYAQTLSALKDAQSNIFTTLIVSIVTAALVILFAVMLIVRERTQEIGLLKAIGASNWQVISQFAAEVLSLSGVAAAIAAILMGVAGGALASKFNISTNPASSFGGPGGLVGTFHIARAASPIVNQAPFSAGLTPSTLLLVLGLGVALAVLASIVPAWYVARIKPADVLRAD